MTAFSRRLAFAAVAGAVLAGEVSGPAGAQSADAPARLMDRYAEALRSNNVEAIVSLFTVDGVYIRPDFEPVIGHDALRAAYRHVFETLVVRVAFELKEVEIAGDMAWLRSTSAGTVKELKTGIETRDAYNQIVVLRQAGGVWRIRNYIYAPANAATPART